MVKRKTNPRTFFSSHEKDRIIEAIRQAERRTSGEIRVYLERRAGGDLWRRARKVFEKLKMTHTTKRNGVLIYLSLTDRCFVLLGDKGIHEKVGETFWKQVVVRMQEFFRKEEFLEGLLAGIRELGEKLRLYFPPETDDKNELSDQIPE